MIKMRDIYFICAVSSSKDDDGSPPEGGSLAFTPPGDERSQVVSPLPSSQTIIVGDQQLGYLSKVAMQWHEVDSNRRLPGTKHTATPPRPTP